MTRTEMINKIDRILVKNNMKRNELTWEHQDIELNDDRDLTNCSNGFLEVLLNRAEALDKFFGDLSVWVLTGAHNAAENHDLIYSRHLIGGDEDANKFVMRKLKKILRKYHTNMVDVNVESGDWDDMSGNDGYTVAPKMYLIDYYKSFPEVQAAVKKISGRYVTAGAQNFSKPDMTDVQNELQQLANYIVDKANPDSANTIYYDKALDAAATARV